MPTTTDELKGMIESIASAGSRERDANAEWRGRLSGTVETLALEQQRSNTEQARANGRIEKLERQREYDAGKIRSALDSSADLETSVKMQVSTIEKSLLRQDVEIEGVKIDVAAVRGAVGAVKGELDQVKRETAAQTPIIASTHEAVVGMTAQVSFIKWAIPGLAAVIAATWAAAQAFAR